MDLVWSVAWIKCAVRSDPPSWLMLLAISAVNIIVGCESPTETQPEIPDVRKAVVGAAAQALDARGRFRLAPAQVPGGASIISAEHAAGLARAYLRTFVTNPEIITFSGTRPLREVIEEDHGSPIDWGSLRLDERLAYFAESPYEPFPDSLPGYVRRFFGPHYLVPFYSAAVQPLSVGVAAYNTEATIDGRGFVQLPSPSGGEFIALGVPLMSETGVPPWPEEAVVAVFEATGARTREVPILVKPGDRWAPQGSRWRLTLERPIVVRHAMTGTEITTTEIYIGVWNGPDRGVGTRYGVQWYVPRDEQPLHEDILYTVLGSRPGEQDRRTYTASFRRNRPVAFDFVFPRR